MYLMMSLIHDTVHNHDVVLHTYYRGLPSTPLPSLNSADIALASLFTRRSSIQLAPLPPTPSRNRKSSEPTVGSTPGIGRLRTSLRPDSSDSDDPAVNVVINGSPNTGRRRTQSLLSLKSPIKTKRRESVPQSQGASSSSQVSKGIPRPPYM